MDNVHVLKVKRAERSRPICIFADDPVQEALRRARIILIIALAAFAFIVFVGIATSPAALALNCGP